MSLFRNGRITHPLKRILSWCDSIINNFTFKILISSNNNGKLLKNWSFYYIFIFSLNVFFFVGNWPESVKKSDSKMFYLFLWNQGFWTGWINFGPEKRAPVRFWVKNPILIENGEDDEFIHNKPSWNVSSENCIFHWVELWNAQSTVLWDFCLPKKNSNRERVLHCYNTYMATAKYLKSTWQPLSY